MFKNILKNFAIAVTKTSGNTAFYSRKVLYLNRLSLRHDKAPLSLHLPLKHSSESTAAAHRPASSHFPSHPHSP